MDKQKSAGFLQGFVSGTVYVHCSHVTVCGSLMLACGAKTDNSSRIKMAPELKHASVVIWDQLTQLKSNYINH